MRKVIVLSHKEWDSIKSKLNLLDELRSMDAVTLKEVDERSEEAKKLFKYLEEKAEQHLEDLMDFSYKEDRLAEKIVMLDHRDNYLKSLHEKIIEEKSKINLEKTEIKNQIYAVPKWIRKLFHIKYNENI